MTTFIERQLLNGNIILTRKCEMAYRIFKNKFETEMYHNKTMLRCSTTPSRIETSRYERLPDEQRVCKDCDSNNVEDEMHFLISCYTAEN